MIHILIVNNEHLVSDLLAQAINTQADMTVTGQVSTSSAALQALDANSCNVLLVDLLLNDQGARQLIATVGREFPDVQCLVIGLQESDTVLLRCLEMGVAGYLHEDDSLEDMITKIRYAACGEALISPQIASALIARLVELKWLATGSNGYRTVTLQQQMVVLTVREREILGFIEQGWTNGQIAEQLVISLGTVKNHVHNILDKLDVHTRRQAAMVAQRVAVEQAVSLPNASQRSLSA